MKTELCEIMTKHGSDKGRGHHNFTIFYDSIFSNIRKNKLTIFELGLGTNNTDVPSNMGKEGKPGASLRGWVEYFKNSLVFGADIDKRILFEEGRIKTFYCDQTSTDEIANLWNNEFLEKIEFDIIIEDGLHEFNANLIFLENSLFKLKKDGYYICEDLNNETYEKFSTILDELKMKYKNYEFNLEKIPHEYNNHDNSLLVIKRNI
jgi:hypothetical protein